MDTFEVESTVTKRGQTTLPSAIRKILKVTNAEDRVVYRVLKDGSVMFSKKERPGDPVIAEFLAFITADTRNNLASLRPMTSEWLSVLQEFVRDVEVDLDAGLREDDE